MDSAWIAIAGGTGALVGGIGAQLVNARYARNRADRDLMHNRWGHWRDERLSAYLNLFGAIESWLKIYSAYRAQVETTKGLNALHGTDNTDKITNFIHFNSVAARYGEIVSTHHVKVQALGSASFVVLSNSLDHFLQTHIDWQRSVTMGIDFQISSGEESWNDIFESHDGFEGAVRSRINRMVTVARDDLGTTVEFSKTGAVAKVASSILNLPSWCKKTWREVSEVWELKMKSKKNN